MRQPDVEPTVTPCDRDRDSKTLSHPSYAQISVSRISGMKNLYGSDFTHQSYVAITVSPSTVTRDLSRDWPHASTKPIIRLALSESQWATFVSSFGVGAGVQCTLEYADGELKPNIAHRDSADEYKAEADKDLQDAIDHLKALKEKLESGTSKLSKTAAADLVNHVNASISSLNSSLPFVAESFSRHMEKRAEKAKVEVNAYINQTVHRAGLEALMDEGRISRPLIIDQSRDEE